MAKWVEKIERSVSKYPFDGGEYVGNVMSQYGKREVMHRSSFDSYFSMNFEDDTFKVCVGWEEYLKNIYM